MARFYTDDRIDAGKKIILMIAVKPAIEDLIPAKEIGEERKNEKYKYGHPVFITDYY